MSFEQTDQFLRRVRFRDQIKRNLVHWRAFNDGDRRMSLTFRDPDLQTNDGIRNYHEYFSKALPEPLAAVLSVTFRGLVAEIAPPLEPEYDIDDSDPKYGKLHCSTERPDRARMELLAKLVNDGLHASIVFRPG